MFLKITVVFLQFLLFALCTDVNVRKIEKQTLDHILSATQYDPRIRPNAINSTDGPVTVSVNMYVKRVHIIDEINMKYSMDIFFREEWVDERLKYSDANGRIKYLTLDDEEFIWTPDLFFNDFKAYHHDVTRPNILLRISPNGSVLLSKRYTILLHCPMDLSNYPFDKQTCDLRIESYAWTTKGMLLKWKQGDHMKQIIDIPLYSISTSINDGNVTLNGNEYVFLLFSLTFDRELNYYLIHIFMPTTMLVIAAYLTFWIDTKQFTARIILGVATLYTLAMMITDFNKSIQKVSYIKSIDIFTGISLTFVFFALIETILVHLCENCKEINTKDIETLNGKIEGKDDEETNKCEKMKKLLMKWNFDKSSRMIYPLGYASFQILYLAIYLCI